MYEVKNLPTSFWYQVPNDADRHLHGLTRLRSDRGALENGMQVLLKFYLLRFPCQLGYNYEHLLFEGAYLWILMVGDIALDDGALLEAMNSNRRVKQALTEGTYIVPVV